ncbi:MAG: hypothetical protein LBU69_00630 [Deltaproteobacteria bacterium]|nr:hypothetical protein [Deltaproteobacteria bacterium]
MVTGLAVNALRTQGELPLGWRPGAPSPVGGVTEITGLEALEALMAQPGSTILDARDPDLYRLGRIPGALSLPTAELDQLLGPFLAQANPLNPVIAYCSESLCPLAGRLATALAEGGHKNVYLYSPGFDRWAELGRPIEKD